MYIYKVIQREKPNSQPTYVLTASRERGVIVRIVSNLVLNDFGHMLTSLSDILFPNILKCEHELTITHTVLIAIIYIL